MGDLLGGHVGERAAHLTGHAQSAEARLLIDLRQAEVGELAVDLPSTLVVRMFAGLMSRWINPSSWA